MFIRPIWAEINLGHIEHNIKTIKSLLPPNTQVMACVKGNGYGHGAVQIARKALQSGVNYLAVASVDEAIELREGNITAPILVFGYIPPSMADIIVKFDLTQTIYQEDLLIALSKAAIRHKKIVKVHIKVDTGLGRIGLTDIKEIIDFIKLTNIQPGIHLESLFSQFATADEPNSEYAEQQIDQWNSIIAAYKDTGIRIPLLHISNSAGIFRYSLCGGNMVRLGISMYGYDPYPSVLNNVNLHPAIKVMSQIIHIKQVAVGTKIGYGATFETQRESIIATVPIGYGDGFPRFLSNKGEVLVRGKRVPVTGRVCMDQIMIDVTDVSNVRLNDEVEIYGGSSINSITIDEVAAHSGTIRNEMLSWISRRVPRCYIDSNLSGKKESTVTILTNRFSKKQCVKGVI